MAEKVMTRLRFSRSRSPRSRDDARAEDRRASARVADRAGGRGDKNAVGCIQFVKNVGANARNPLELVFCSELFLSGR